MNQTRTSEVTMTKRMVMTLLGLLVAVSMADAQKKETTIIGEVVDIVSYITKGMKPNTPDGKEILDASVKGGNPLGLLETKTGKLYVVTMKQANTSATATLLPFTGIKVAASGKVYKRGSCQLLIMSVIGKSIK
jgi:hypothetical protein